MSNKNISWFHCGHCGSLFQTTAGSFNRQCSVCGKNPSPAAEVLQAKSESSSPRKKAITDGKNKNNHKNYKYIWISALVVFCSLIVLAVAIVIIIDVNDEISQNENSLSEKNKTTDIVEEKIESLLNQAIPLCNLAISQFISLGTPEALNQYVFSPVATAARMADFYKLNPLLSIDSKALTLIGSAVVHLPVGKAVEINFNSNDGLQLDAVFLQENGEWRLDWEHFVRFSKHPWSLFLAGGGDVQEEFRLLARQRLADDRKNADTMSIVFYAPRVGHPSELGSQSPEFLVKRDSKNGRLLDAAFNLEKSGKRVFGVNLSSNDPDGMIRVRVKIRRIDESNERRFVLEDVVACHWYTVDEPGMEILDQPLDK